MSRSIAISGIKHLVKEWARLLKSIDVNEGSRENLIFFKSTIFIII